MATNFGPRIIPAELVTRASACWSGTSLIAKLVLLVLANYIVFGAVLPLVRVVHREISSPFAKEGWTLRRAFGDDAPNLLQCEHPTGDSRALSGDVGLVASGRLTATGQRLLGEIGVLSCPHCSYELQKVFGPRSLDPGRAFSMPFMECSQQIFPAPVAVADDSGRLARLQVRGAAAHGLVKASSVAVYMRVNNCGSKISREIGVSNIAEIIYGTRRNASSLPKGADVSEPSDDDQEEERERSSGDRSKDGQGDAGGHVYGPGSAFAVNGDVGSLRVVSQRPLAIPHLEHGPEDPRAFNWQGKNVVMVNLQVPLKSGRMGRRIFVHFPAESRSIMLRLRAGHDTIATAANPSQQFTLILDDTEKNWTPLVIDDELYIIYRWEPLVVLRCGTDGGCDLSFAHSIPQTGAKSTTVRGSSTFLPVPGLSFGQRHPYYFGFVHSNFMYDPRVPASFYRTHMVVLRVGEPASPPTTASQRTLAASGPALRSVGWEVAAFSDAMRFDWSALGLDLKAMVQGTLFPADQSPGVRRLSSELAGGNGAKLRANGSRLLSGDTTIEPWLEFFTGAVILDSDGVTPLAESSPNRGRRLELNSSSTSVPSCDDFVNGLYASSSGKSESGRLQLQIWGYLNDRTTVVLRSQGLIEWAQAAAAANAGLCTLPQDGESVRYGGAASDAASGSGATSGSSSGGASLQAPAFGLDAHAKDHIEHLLHTCTGIFGL